MLTTSSHSVQVFMEWLMTFERHWTRTSQEKTYAFVLYVAQLLNMALVLMLVNASPVADVSTTDSATQAEEVCTCCVKRRYKFTIVFISFPTIHHTNLLLYVSATRVSDNVFHRMCLTLELQQIICFCCSPADQLGQEVLSAEWPVQRLQPCLVSIHRMLTMYTSLL